MLLLSDIVWDQNTLAVAGAFAVPIAAILGGIWFKVNKMRSQDALKRSMVERGMSVADIERVLAAGTSKDDHD